MVIKPNYRWFVEEVPEEQLNVKLWEVTFYHEKVSNYGRRALEHVREPFFICKVKDEKVSAFKTRIKAHLDTKRNIKTIAKIDKGGHVTELKNDELVEISSSEYLTIMEQGARKDPGALKIE